jgi:hypothetical protein
MYDAGKVVAGLAVLVVIVTLPFWLRAVGGVEAGAAAPELEIVTEAEQCVEATAYMRALHMDLLNSWRDDVVRGNDRYHQAPDGTVYEKSLSRTCMDCHSNKSKFCDRCHDYAAVNPYCWDCHVEPEEVQ